MEDTPDDFTLMEPVSPETLIPGYSMWWPVLGIIVLIVIILGLVLLIRALRKTRVSPTAARDAAYKVALLELESIKEVTAREAAVIVSLTLRKYLAEAVQDPALYETHEEFIARRDSLQTLTDDAKTAAASGFDQLALLKYAPATPEQDPATIVADAKSLLQTLHHGFRS